MSKLIFQTQNVFQSVQNPSFQVPFYNFYCLFYRGDTYALFLTPSLYYCIAKMIVSFLSLQHSKIVRLHFCLFCFLPGDSLSTTKISGDFESSKDTSHYSTLEGDLDDSFFSRYVTIFFCFIRLMRAHFYSMVLELQV